MTVIDRPEMTLSDRQDLKIQLLRTLSEEACLYAGTDWLKVISQPEGGERSIVPTGNRLCTFSMIILLFSTQTLLILNLSCSESLAVNSVSIFFCFLVMFWSKFDDDSQFFFFFFSFIFFSLCWTADTWNNLLIWGQIVYVHFVFFRDDASFMNLLGCECFWMCLLV